MNRSVYTLGGLLFVALVLSYLSWTQKPDVSAEGKVRLVDISSDTLERFVWATPEERVEVSALEDAHGDWLRVAVERLPARKKPLATNEEDIAAEPGEEGEGGHDESDPGPDQEPGDERETTGEGGSSSVGNGKVGSEAKVIFTGGPQARRLVDAIAPLLATRSLENVGDDRLEAMGFEGSETSMKIVGRGRTHVFEVGGMTHGDGYRYIRRPEGRDVYLVQAGPLRTLEHGARRLMQRELLDLRRPDIEKVTVRSADGRIVTMVHRAREGESRRSYFANQEEPDRPMQQYDNWIGSLLSLRATSYLEEDRAPSILEPVAQLAFETEEASQPIGVDLLRGVDEQGEEQWFARTDHTRSLVSLQKSAAEALMGDLDAIF